MSVHISTMYSRWISAAKKVTPHGLHKPVFMPLFIMLRVVDVLGTETAQPYINSSLVVPDGVNKSEGALNLPCKLYTTDSAEL